MYNEWENKKIHGIHASRYIASFINEGGNILWFDEWLKSLVIDGEKLTDEEILHITYLADNGKMELEHNVRTFFKQHPEAQV